jgi:phosphoribosylpyrophosphate synthetase
LVTDTVRVPEEDWPRLRVISIAPVIAGALERFLADGSIRDLYRGEDDRRDGATTLS